MNVEIYPFNIYSASFNMALDEALFALSTKRNTGFLRFYGWEEPCYSLGYFQKPVCNKYAKYPSVRRMTGGGTVFHGKDLTFAFAGVLKKPFDNTAAIYQFFGRLLMKSLLDSVPPDTIELSRRNKSKQKYYNCFDTPAAADITYKKKKIYGGAIRKRKKHFLFQGTLQEDAILQNKTKVMENAVNLIKSAFSDVKETALPDEIMKEAKKLENEKYRQDAWNYPKKQD
jgi:lipoate-protein ligase A